jgi:hypothetical protein
MFESRDRLTEEIGGLLDAFRTLGGGRYACLLEPKGRLPFESAESESEGHWMLRRFLEQRTEALFRLPAAMASGEPMEDVFADWEDDAFFLAFINGRVALVVACPDPEALKEQAERPLRALADRLFRYNAAFRLDEKGRGLFLGRARLDMIVIGRAEGAE